MSYRNHLALALAGAALLAGRLAAAGAPAVAAVPALPKFDEKNPAVYGKQIAEYVHRFDSGWNDAYAKADLTIISASGDKSTSQVTIMVKEDDEGNKTLIRYLGPADVRGVAALTHERHASTDQSWLYLPSSRRVRRISGANRTSSFQGTEFTYEDISTIVPSRYDWKFSRKEKLGSEQVLVVEARPNYADSGYSRLDVYVNAKYWRIERIDFYDEASRLLKVLTHSDWKHHHKRFWRPQTLTMVNKQTKRQSVLALEAQFVDLRMYKKSDGTQREGLSAELFTQRALDPK